MSYKPHDFQDQEVAQVFAGYPEKVRHKMLKLRQLIFDTAMKSNEISEVQESLKWGEPSYSTPTGSPVRIAWKVKTPGVYGMYFHCQTTLVETFRELYGDCFIFEGNRAIIFELKQTFPETLLNHCIELALTYQRRKHLPLLGA